MIFALLLTGIEKLVNVAIQSDQITQAGLQSLSGKVLRLNMQFPELHVDIIFNDQHLRFEPVNDEPIFEDNQQYTDLDHQKDQEQAKYHQYGHSKPDCTLNVSSVVELLNLLKEPEGNLPIEGDYKVLMHLRMLIAGFQPDIAAQLEPFIGVGLASQLTQLIEFLKVHFDLSGSGKQAFNEFTDWANEVSGNATPTPEQKAESNDLHQQLLKLRADVEREQAKLDAIKQQQAQLQENLSK